MNKYTSLRWLCQDDALLLKRWNKLILLSENGTGMNKYTSLRWLCPNDAMLLKRWNKLIFCRKMKPETRLAQLAKCLWRFDMISTRFYYLIKVLLVRFHCRVSSRRSLVTHWLSPHCALRLVRCYWWSHLSEVIYRSSFNKVGLVKESQTFQHQHIIVVMTETAGGAFVGRFVVAPIRLAHG